MIEDMTSVSLLDLADQPWVLFPSYERQGLHERIRAACIGTGFEPRVVQEAVLMSTIVGLVSSRMGIGLVSRSFSNIQREGVVFRELKGQGCPIDYEICVAYARASPVIKTFLECIHSEARPA